MTGPTEDTIEEWAWNLLTVLFYLPVTLGSLLYLLWSGGEFALWTRTLGEAPLVGLLAGVGASIPMIAASLGLPRFVPALARLRRGLKGVVGSLSVPSILLVAVASSVGEELLFRAVIQEQLGLPVAVVLFALAHIPLERDLWLWPVTALVAGLVFGGLYAWTGAALAPIVAHFLINLTSLWSLSVTSGSTGSAT